MSKEHPLLEEQKTLFRLGKKRFVCNQCGKTHNISSDRSIRYCVYDASYGVVSKERAKELPLIKWLQSKPRFLESLMRAKKIDPILVKYFESVEELIEDISDVNETSYFRDYWLEMVNKAALLSMSKKDREIVIEDHVAKDLSKRMNILIENISNHKIEDRINFILGGGLFKFNAWLHDWQSISVDETLEGPLKKYWEKGVKLYELPVLGEFEMLLKKDIDARMTPDELQYRCNVTGLILSVPFEPSKSIRAYFPS